MQRDRLLIAEMLAAAREIRALTAGRTVADLTAERQRRDALLWNYAVLGEASTQVSAELKGRFPDVPWQRPASLRHRIVHGYWSIDLEILHATAHTQIPDLIAALEALERTLARESDPG